MTNWIKDFLGKEAVLVLTQCNERSVACQMPMKEMKYKKSHKRVFKKNGRGVSIKLLLTCSTVTGTECSTIEEK